MPLHFKCFYTTSKLLSQDIYCSDTPLIRFSVPFPQQFPFLLKVLSSVPFPPHVSFYTPTFPFICCSPSSGCLLFHFSLQILLWAEKPLLLWLLISNFFKLSFKFSDLYRVSEISRFTNWIKYFLKALQLKTLKSYTSKSFYAISISYLVKMCIYVWNILN